MMRHLSIRRVRSVSIVVLIILICIFTFMAIANKDSLENRENSKIVNSLEDFKEMKNDLEFGTPDDNFTKEMNKGVNENNDDKNLSGDKNSDKNVNVDIDNSIDDNDNNIDDNDANNDNVDNDNNLDDNAADDANNDNVDNDNNLDDNAADDAKNDNVDNDNNLDDNAADDANNGNVDNDNNLDGDNDNNDDTNNDNDTNNDDTNNGNDGNVDNDNNLDGDNDNNNSNDNDNGDDNGNNSGNSNDDSSKGKDNKNDNKNEDTEDKTLIDVSEVMENDENTKPVKKINFKTKKSFKLYHRGSNYRDGDDPEGKECPVPWEWVDNKEDSDIIVLNVLDNLSEINSIERFNYDKNRQKLLLMSMESTSNYDVMITKKKYFDYAIDYRLDADVPIPYTYDFFNFSKPALPLKEKGKDGRGIAAVFISNCSARNSRLEFLKELMKYAKIDSYGMCLNNKDIYEEDQGDSAWNSKMNTIRKYKFTLAFENSDDRDYVTEKFFQPLEAGSVPVFYGTANIADFAPEHSYIDANDFENAKELAEFLNHLDKDDKEYESYLEWKKKNKLGDNLEHLIEIRKLNSICQLLQSIKGLWKNPYLTKWNRNDVSKNERACILCEN